MDDKIIEIKNVYKSYDEKPVVKNVSLSIKRGEFVTFLGPSGCGKTTTLRMIAGFEQPTSGQILFEGQDITQLPPHKRNINTVFQKYALFPHLSVFGNIAFGLKLKSVPDGEPYVDKKGNTVQKMRKLTKTEIADKVNDALRMVDLEDYGHRAVNSLSGGQQQRVAIARTLAPSPKVLFMDEPLSNLDAKLRLEMRTELKRLHADTDSTFVYVTHDQLEAMTLATKVCLMNEGILQQYAPPLDVYKHPANLFVADFVGNPTMNFIKGTATVTGGGVKVNMLGREFLFKGNSQVELAPETPVVVGIRPEYVRLDQGTLGGVVYATLPSGMETTVKLSVGEEIITAVVFGSIDYQVNSNVSFALTGHHVLLFDEQSTEAVAIGTIEPIK